MTNITASFATTPIMGQPPWWSGRRTTAVLSEANGRRANIHSHAYYLQIMVDPVLPENMVYILFRWTDHSGDEVLGVFATLELAQTHSRVAQANSRSERPWEPTPGMPDCWRSTDSKWFHGWTIQRYPIRGWWSAQADNIAKVAEQLSQWSAGDISHPNDTTALVRFVIEEWHKLEYDSLGEATRDVGP